MARDLHLISDVERQAVLDALRHRYDLGQLSLAELHARTSRVNAAQTHAGLESVLMDLPPEPRAPPKSPTPPKPPKAPKPPKPPRSTAPRRLPSRPSLPAVPPLRVPQPLVHLHTVVLGAIALLAAFTLLVYIASGRQVVSPPSSADPEETEATGSEPPDVGRQLVLLVGRDIQPGRHLSVTAPCYWDRLGDRAAVLANDDTTAGHTVVDVLASDTYLRSKGCEWRPYTPPATPATTFSNGDWLVGEDVEPGRYRSTREGGPRCSWERAEEFSHDPDTVVDSHVAAGEGAVDVTIAAGERFTSRNCGIWNRIA